MAYEQRPNTGSLFRNDKKEADTHADYRGTALVGGVEYWLDAWINESSSGSKYMSLKLKPKNGAGLHENMNRTAQRPQSAAFDEEAPF
jgi:uncharacterized protein (DUF736 family)